MNQLISKIILPSFFSVVVLVGDGLVNNVTADSRLAFGGRAATVAEQAPAIIIENSKNDGLFLLELGKSSVAPTAGENITEKSLNDPYFDKWEDDEFSTNISGDIADPIEPWNRFWQRFNNILWRQYGQAIWKTYELVTPTKFRQGVTNVFNNIAFPIRFVNSLLQGKPTEAGVEFQRFIMNTTLGVGGIMNPGANSKPLWCAEPDAIGFAQTLARWGMGDGFYIVWPVIGPSTVRESVGLVGDFAVNPFTYASLFWERGLTNAAIALRTNHTLGESLEGYNYLVKISVEPYSAIRNAYVQGSRSRVIGVEDTDQ